MFHFQSRNLTRKTGKDICHVTNNEKQNDWEEIEEQPVTKFKCEMQSRRCEYVAASTGKRCRLQTRRALPYCWQHAQIADHVIIRKSEIAGTNMLGLFACDRNKGPNEVVFRKGDRISIYARKASGNKQAIGEFMSDQEMADRYGECVTSPYGVDVPREKVAVDTACQRSIASYSNSSTSEAKSNAEMVWNKNATELLLIAKKAIYNGDEILWYYGSTYRFEYPGFFDYSVSHTRRKSTNAKCRRKKSRRRKSSRRRR